MQVRFWEVLAGSQDGVEERDAEAEAARVAAWELVGDAAEEALSTLSHLPGEDGDQLRRILAAADRLAQRGPRVRPLPQTFAGQR